MSSNLKQFEVINTEETDDDLAESWVAIQCSDRESIVSMGSGTRCLQSSCDANMEQLLYEAQQEGSTPSISRIPSKCSSVVNSPPKPQSLQNSAPGSVPGSPLVSGHHSPDDDIAPLKDVLPKLIGEEKKAEWVWDWSSQPTCKQMKKTQFRHPKRKGTLLSLRNTKAMKYDFLSWEFMQIFIPTLVISNLLAFGVGVYVGKRIASAKNT
ncbi:unnamed protein product [Clavelina lepadiformis]|uniref:BCL2/adenovirus E1B 19 kDa protein-interacting protein 3-like n=1 Tax=Clavelina lepadiformis TaxID=159417 RepID=A0ABP0EVJ0_CLALP